MVTEIQKEVERELAASEPEVEVLLAEVSGGSVLRVFIDHPDGVTLALCERVSGALTPMRDRFALEVSSPGTKRPLSKPDHFRRYLGQRARLRTRGTLRADCQEPKSREGQPAADQASPRSITGELLDASDSQVTVGISDGVVTIPYEQIVRSNLVEQ